jgi:16S rRNA (cytosine1402-N4)-methyltransferase
MHVPVLLTEAIKGLAIKRDGIYIDATFGRGGHSQAILTELGPTGRLIAIDKDPEAVAFARMRFKQDARFVIEQESFSQLQAIAAKHQILGCVDGILMDLGVSSPQLGSGNRGFSFVLEGPLDMRMDTTKGQDAASWLNVATEENIAVVLDELGEERFAKRIAKAIVEQRKLNPIKTTKQLADVVAHAVPYRERKKHPATRSFQAIRIYINHELSDIQTCLDQSLEVLAVQGRIVVISFHSLEDRIVKQFMHKQSQRYEPVAHHLMEPKEIKPQLKKIGRSIKPTQMEIKNNPRARSAILRIAEKSP